MKITLESSLISSEERYLFRFKMSCFLDFKRSRTGCFPIFAGLHDKLAYLVGLMESFESCEGKFVLRCFCRVEFDNGASLLNIISA